MLATHPRERCDEQQADQGAFRFLAIGRHADRVQSDRDGGAGTAWIPVHSRALALSISGPAADGRLRQDRDHHAQGGELVLADGQGAVVMRRAKMVEMKTALDGWTGREAAIIKAPRPPDTSLEKIKAALV